MQVRYLHTMVRVKDLDASIAFYKLLGLEQTRRNDYEGGRLITTPFASRCAHIA